MTAASKSETPDLTTEVVFAVDHIVADGTEYEGGASATLSAAEARELIRSGHARAATPRRKSAARRRSSKPAAKKAAAKKADPPKPPSSTDEGTTTTEGGAS